MTDEQNERLKQIRERSESKKRVAAQFEWAQVGLQEWADIDFLLSLVDSQVAGNYDNKRYENLVEEMSVNSEEVKAIAARAFHTPRFNADTYMFDVRQLLRFHQVCCAELHDAIALVRTLDRQLHFEKMASQGAINYTIELEQKLENTATSMRSRCIEKVKQVERLLRGDAELAAERLDTVNHAALLHKAEAMKALAKSLESVTIQEQEKQNGDSHL